METNDTVTELMRQKLIIMNEFFDITQQQLLLVDLEALEPLLERKNTLIREMQLIDEALALHQHHPPESAAMQAEIENMVEAILENERTLEERLLAEQSRLRQEMRDLDQETQLKQYLQKARAKGGTVNLKQ